MESDVDIETLSKLVKTLADPNRLRIIEVLTTDCQSVSDIVAATGLTQPLVSHHLRVLREEGLAGFERRGAFTYY
jgi:DNA-binding transcriptional ArsR family regulator